MEKLIRKLRRLLFKRKVKEVCWFMDPRLKEITTDWEHVHLRQQGTRRITYAAIYPPSEAIQD